MERTYLSAEATTVRALSASRDAGRQESGREVVDPRTEDLTKGNFGTSKPRAQGCAAAHFTFSRSPLATRARLFPNAIRMSHN